MLNCASAAPRDILWFVNSFILQLSPQLFFSILVFWPQEQDDEL